MAGLLGDQYTPDPLAQGLLGLGSALLTPRQLGGGLMAGANAFNQGATQAAMLRRQMAQDAERSQFLRDRADMERKRFGMDEQKFGLEMDQFRAAQTRQQQQEQFVSDFIATAAQKDPEIATLARVDLKAAIERAFPKPEWRTWFDEKGRQTQGYAAPGQAPQQVGGVQRNMQSVNLGDRVAFVDPLEQSSPLTMGQSPDSKASTGLGYARLGEDRRQFGITSGMARERLDLERTQAGADGGFQYIQTPTGLVAVPKKPGEGGSIASRPVVDAAGLPVGGERNTAAQTKVTEANDAIALIDQAEKLISRSTGSYAGAGIDLAAQVLGVSTPGAQAAAQLKALQGALVSKMPKMSGPQSDKDVQLYREMAGQVGDPTIPAATKMAALQTIREIQERYAGMQPGASRPKPPEAPKVPEQAFSSLPPASQYRGKTVRDTLTGKSFKSNGMSWVEQ